MKTSWNPKGANTHFDLVGLSVNSFFAMVKKLFLPVIFFVSITFTALAQPAPYGIDRRPRDEAYLNGKFPDTDAGQFPPLLSQTGAFEDTKNFKVARAIIPYTVNTPLWSDAADKLRWLHVPKDTTIGFSPTTWSFPPGTVFVKHFDLIVNEQTGQRRRLETRFLVVDKANHVYGVTYIWDPNGQDAALDPGQGKDITGIDIIGADGTTRKQDWHFPSRAECLECHTKEIGGNNNKGILGVKTAQLNGNFAYPQAGGGAITDNQLRTLNHLGLFSPAINEAAIPTLPKMAAITDTTVNMETRVRSYLDANCAHCHNPNGSGGRFDARFHIPFRNPNSQGLVNVGRNFINFMDTVDTQKSRILVRDSSRPRNAMPPLATFIVDKTWTNLLTIWINTAFNPTNATPAPLQNQITVTFNDVPEAASGKAVANYVLKGPDPNKQFTLSNPVLDANNRTVTFDVAPPLGDDTEYTLKVNNVLDRLTPVNTCWPDQTLNFKTGTLVAANDNWANAAVIVGVNATEFANNTGATEESGEPDHAGNAGGASLWWKWTAPSSGFVTFDTSGSQIDTLLAVYTGSNVASLTVVTNSDDDSPLLTSRVVFFASAGVDYYIAVDGHNHDVGDLELNLQPGGNPLGPVNDMFASALQLSGVSGNVSGNSQNATKEPDEPNHGHNEGGASVWWYWTAPTNGLVEFDTAGSAFDTTLAAYTGTNVSTLFLVAENDDDGNLSTSSITFMAVAGETYHIAVDSYTGEGGAITLNYTLTPGPAPLIIQSFIQKEFTFQLKIVGAEGAQVEVQVSDDLIHWAPLTNGVVSGGKVWVNDAIVPSVQQRFYRAVLH